MHFLNRGSKIGVLEIFLKTRTIAGTQQKIKVFKKNIFRYCIVMKVFRCLLRKTIMVMGSIQKWKSTRDLLGCDHGSSFFVLMIADGDFFFNFGFFYF